MSVAIGVDVGTGSARAGVFSLEGAVLGAGVAAIETTHPAPDFAQQSSAEIWRAVAHAVRAAVAEAGVTPDAVVGLGFDATCSLVVSGADGAPVSVDPEGRADQDVILWMDHRATPEADDINRIGGTPLDYVGGRISPEMEMPKLLWLKQYLPRAWADMRRAWDLPDWLVHKATGGETRSLCSAVCKWTYLGHLGQAGEGWDRGFLDAIGLGDLTAEVIGTAFAPPGALAGRLTESAAADLGLQPGIAVGASLIDAHAGALGTLGVAGGDPVSRLAMIAGTSTCHIGLTREPVFVPGVWGPYFGVVLGGYWALEGGQSAAGALLDAVIARHAASATLDLRGDERVSDALDARLAKMPGETAFQSRDRHLQPDFHGNRSPLAEPWRRGGLDGLTLHGDADDLARDYLAAQHALAYGTRAILEAMAAEGEVFDSLVVSGGLAKNPLYLQSHADVTGCRVVVPAQQEPVLLGSAMLGAVAAGRFADLPSAMATMSGEAREIAPRGGKIAAYHAKKYQVFRRMQDDHAAYRAIMAEGW
ncbi:MAG: FGGY-family carbohydrate kinase [Pseudomonadota bacterium]